MKINGNGSHASEAVRSAVDRISESRDRLKLAVRARMSHTDELEAALAAMLRKHGSDDCEICREAMKLISDTVDQTKKHVVG